MRIKLGELLVKAGVLTDDQVNRALDYQRQHPGERKLGETIIALRMASEEQILVVLAAALKLKAVDLSKITPQGAALGLVPAHTAEKYEIVPLKIDTVGAAGRKRLIIAMSDPTNLAIVDELQFKTGMIVQPVLSTSTQVRNSLRRLYGGGFGGFGGGDGGGGGSAVPIDIQHDPTAPAGKVVILREGVEKTWIGGAPTKELPKAVVRLIGYAGPAKDRTIEIPIGGSVVIGRSNESDIAISDLRMSRRHFMVADVGSGVEVVDMASSNGTFVNQKPAGNTKVKHGDWIQAGESIFRVAFPGSS